jgi:putative hydrolase of the HAD superfamily
VIFDLGGVLLRTETYEPRHAWDRRLGLAPGTVESVVHGIDAWRQAQRGLITPNQYWKAVADQLHLGPEDLDRLRRDFYAGDRLDSSLVNLITTLRQEKVLIGLLSNNSLEALAQLTALGIAPLFDHCVISAEIGVMKPAPEAYHSILEQLEVAPQQALFIDDSPENVEGARACGMVSIRFSPEADLEPAIREWLSKDSGGS